MSEQKEPKWVQDFREGLEKEELELGPGLREQMESSNLSYSTMTEEKLKHILADIMEVHDKPGMPAFSRHDVKLSKEVEKFRAIKCTCHGVKVENCNC